MDMGKNVEDKPEVKETGNKETVEGKVEPTPQKGKAVVKVPQKVAPRVHQKVAPKKVTEPKKKRGPIRKLSVEEVKEIKKLLKAGKLTQMEIAKRFDYEAGNISRNGSGKLWKAVK